MLQGFLVLVLRVQGCRACGSGCKNSLAACGSRFGTCHEFDSVLSLGSEHALSFPDAMDMSTAEVNPKSHNKLRTPELPHAVPS